MMGLILMILRMTNGYRDRDSAFGRVCVYVLAFLGEAMVQHCGRFLMGIVDE